MIASALKRRLPLVLVAAAISVFVALYPVLDCARDKCPDASPSGPVAICCAVAVLATSPLVPARAAGRAAVADVERALVSQADRSPKPRPPRTLSDLPGEPSRPPRRSGERPAGERGKP